MSYFKRMKVRKSLKNRYFKNILFIIMATVSNGLGAYDGLPIIKRVSKPGGFFTQAPKVTLPQQNTQAASAEISLIQQQARQIIGSTYSTKSKPVGTPIDTHITGVATGSVAQEPVIAALLDIIKKHLNLFLQQPPCILCNACFFLSKYPLSNLTQREKQSVLEIYGQDLGKLVTNGQGTTTTCDFQCFITMRFVKEMPVDCILFFGKFIRNNPDFFKIVTPAHLKNALRACMTAHSSFTPDYAVFERSIRKMFGTEFIVELNTLSQQQHVVDAE